MIMDRSIQEMEEEEGTRRKGLIIQGGKGDDIKTYGGRLLQRQMLYKKDEVKKNMRKVIEFEEFLLGN